jgi:SNF2 family DNA or RNA helicase
LTVSVPATPDATARGSLEPWILDEVQYYPHQIEGVRQLARRKSFLLADDMGLGKSLQAMTIFAVDIVMGLSKTALIVCPVTLKGNWADEFEKFTRIPHVVLQGTPVQRSRQILDFEEMPGPKALIVNYEQVVSHLRELNALGFDIVIFDEAHYLKNPKAVRTKKCIDLSARRHFLLTGTPMLNHVDELWSILHIIDPFKFPKFWTFVSRYAVFGGYKDKQIIGVKNEKELTDRLHGVMLRRLKKDVLDLPEVQIIERRVDLSTEQRKLYDEVANEMRLPRVGNATPDDIENALTKFLRLKQICGTTFEFTGEDHSSKLDLAIEDDLELLARGEKIVQFTQFRGVQTCYGRRIEKAAPGVPVFFLNGDVKMDQRQGVIKSWRDVKGPAVIVPMLQVAGVGINLTATPYGSFLDKLFVPGLNQQAIDRLHRIGASTTQPVQIREYLCRGTIESRVNQILRVKSKLFGEIVESDPNWKAKLYKYLEED